LSCEAGTVLRRIGAGAEQRQFILGNRQVIE
jgi:hypothetical protein